MKKKLFFSTLCFILLLIMMLSTTLAWFTDTEANVNTMVAGKISITQTVVADNDVIIVPTVEIDRVITVENTGNLPCYVRTLIAFEDAAVAGTGTIDAETGEVIEGSEMTLAEYLKLCVTNDEDELVASNLVIPGVTNDEAKVQYTRNGVTYTIGYYVHAEALAVAASYTCLDTIILNETAPSEWNVAAGDKYEILVLSQAVQVAGFEPAVDENGDPTETVAEAAAAALNDQYVFGVVNAENVKTWFDTVVTTNP